jgi:hypothetical protein
MRTFALALVVISALLSPSAPSFAGPPCNIHVGGLCGSDYDGWMQNWHRGNPGRTIQPVSPGGYGLSPNGQRFYPNQGGQELPQRRFYGGTPQPGYGQGYGYGGQMNQGSVTVIQAHPWTGHRVNGVFFCDSGPCPRNGIYGN